MDKEEKEEEEEEERELVNMCFYQFWPVSLFSGRANVLKLFHLEVNGDVYSMLRYCHLVLGYTNLVYGALRGSFRGPFREPNELQIVRNDQSIGSITMKCQIIFSDTVI